MDRNYGSTANTDGARFCDFRASLGPLLLGGVFLLIFSASAFAQRIQVGQGSYTTSRPAGERSVSNEQGSTALPYVTERVTGPIPTNTWWSTLLYKYEATNFWSANLFPHPLAVRAWRDGLGISHPETPTISPDGRHYRYPYDEDLRVGIGGRYDAGTLLQGMDSPATWVDGYSDWTVTALWKDEVKGRLLRATFGHGLPYVYFEKEGGAAASVAMASGKSVKVWHDGSGTLALTIAGKRHYALFAPPGSTWREENGVFYSDLNGGAFFSVAALPDNDPATLVAFQSRAFAFVTDTRVGWTYVEASATLVTDYEVKTELKVSSPGAVNRPFLALYRHQWQHADADFTGYAYASPRGRMKVLDSNGFRTRMAFLGVLPNLPLAPNVDKGRLRGYVEAVVGEGNLIPRDGRRDTYWTGKAMTRITSLIPLAHQVGAATSATLLFAQLQARVRDWLNYSEGETEEFFYYDNRWGTLIGFPVSFGSNTDLNDHHFHYGHFLDAASTIARYDPDFVADWGGMVELLIRDVNSPRRDDPLFPFLRAFDPYAGHSWASGHGAFERGNNQESSSEALHFARSLLLWGVEAGDDALRDLGIFLYRTELEATRHYWFDVDDEVFPEGFDHTTVGIVWGDGGAYDTWFSTSAAPIHGINYLPITAGSLYLGYHPDYVIRNYNELSARSGMNFGSWTPLVWSYQALAAPDQLLNRFNTTPNYQQEYGTSKAFTYHWLAALAHFGLPDTTITANVPTYAVLNDERRTYIAYHSGTAPVTVVFSDGFQLLAPPGEVATGEATGSAGEDHEPDASWGFEEIVPHPFSERAALHYRLAEAASVRLEVFDLQGRRVRLIEEGVQPPGSHVLVLDADRLPAGMYLCRLHAGAQVQARTLVLVQ